jgi:hypothetical protein
VYEITPVRAIVERAHTTDHIVDVLLNSDAAGSLNSSGICPSTEQRSPESVPPRGHPLSSEHTDDLVSEARFGAMTSFRTDEHNGSHSIGCEPGDL